MAKVKTLFWCALLGATVYTMLHMNACIDRLQNGGLYTPDTQQQIEHVRGTWLGER